MSTASLVHRHFFGLKQDVPNNVAYSDDQLVVYPVGHSIVIYNTDDKKQKFIHGSDNSEGITALAVCPSKRFIAVAEKAERGVINIYDLKTLKKRKVLSTTDSQSKQFVSLQFSSDNQLLLSQGGHPDWTLLCWNWSKAKAIASIKNHTPGGGQQNVVTSCTFSNVDPAIVCCTGLNLIKFYQILENTFRPMPNPHIEMLQFRCHTWIKQRDDHVIVGTLMGDLLLFHAGEFVTRLSSSPGDGKSVETIVCTSKGIICGSDNSMLYFYQFNEDSNANQNELLTFVKSVQLENWKAKVRNIAVSPTEEQLVVTLSNSQILTMPYHTGDLLKSDEIEYLVTSFHRVNESGQSSLTGMDVCARKPTIVTCALDKTVRVWNYIDKTCELHKQFTEEAHSVSMHPSGLHILVGFSDKLRLMNILMDDIRTFKEFPIKACKECQFSNGGHLFAAVNGNTIQIFSSYTCDMLSNFRGHNGKVRCLYWNHDDSGLISAGMDGAVYQWDLEEAKREGEFVQKGVPYSSALCNREGNAVIAVGTDRILKEIEFPASQLNKEFDTGAILGQLVLSQSQRMLFAGIADPDKLGSVRSYKFPLTNDFVEFPCFNVPVSRMRISSDDHFLFVGGEDGSICIFEIRDKEGRNRARDGEGFSYAEEILVTKSDLEEKNTVMQELKNKVDELTLHNEYQLRLKDMNYNENLKEVTEKFTQELEQDKNKYELLREEKNDMEMEYEERIKQVDEKHLQRMQEVEATNQQKIMKVVECYQEVVQQRDEQKKQWEQEQTGLIRTHELYVSDVTEDFEQRLDEDRQLRIQMEDEKEELGREFAETKRQLEEDIDQEIQTLVGKYESKLSAEREATLRYKGENGIMKKKFSALQNDIEDQREEIKSLLEKEKDLYERIKTLEKEIQAHKREIRSRDETIGEKEKRIYDLKKKNQELEKFKFVLDYKIKELKRQIEPRENEISDMKEQIKEMDQELEIFHKSNAQLDVMIGELRSRLDDMQKDILNQRKQLADQHSLIRRFRCDLYDITQAIQNPKLLREKVAAMYKKFVKDNIRIGELDIDIQHEYDRQKKYLERSVEVLKKKYTKDASINEGENTKIRTENMCLIKEINELRSALQSLKAKVQMKKATMCSTRESNNNYARAKNNNYEVVDSAKIIEEQKRHILKLKRTIKQLDQRVNVAESGGSILPPVKGVDG